MSIEPSSHDPINDDQFRLLFEFSPDAIWLIDPHDIDVPWRIVACNDAACRMTGYSRDELVEHSNSVIDPNWTVDDIDGEHLERMRAAGMLQEEDMLRRKDGTMLDIEYTTRLIQLGGRELILGIDRDISQRKRTEAALIEAKEAAERANLAKSEFLSRMSHELRTPLNAILGFGNHLMSELHDPEHREWLDYIVKSGDHLLELINDVLDIARVEATQLSIDIQPIRLDETIDRALRLVLAHAEQRGIVIRNGFPEPCNTVVEADARRLRQVLVNVFSNAIKYNRPGGRVDIGCELGDETVELAVTDTGNGIAPADIERLFVPFERLDAERDGIEGVGLGLALSRQLVELMQGTITVSSTVGVGTTFRIVLPLAQE